MQTHFPIGSCCARPQVNFVGGIDEDLPGSSGRAWQIMKAGAHAALAGALRRAYDRAREFARLFTR